MARRTGRVRRRHRWLSRCFAVTLGLVLIGALALGGLLLVTPSVGDAQARARALDASHHVAYPGPAVPARFAASLVSTEDHRFYHELGIDPLAVGRLALGRVTGRPDQGGATLYQQLAKMLYTQGHTGVLVDAEQVGLGIKLAVTYSKAQILQMYADVVYFGHGYYGLAAASCGYFGVAPARLTWPQAALLAGVVQAPSADDPIAHLQVARAREFHVLSRLAATGGLTQAQATSAFGQPLGLVGGSGSGCAGQ
jgi:membrane peptidoglycan carboxypeptidase